MKKILLICTLLALLIGCTTPRVYKENRFTKQFQEALNHPIAQKGFDSDFNGMQWADVCVMVLPCGRSANTEAGWMKGAGKRVMVYSPEKQEPELMYKIYDFVSDNIFRINDKIIGV